MEEADWDLQSWQEALGELEACHCRSWRSICVGRRRAGATVQEGAEMVDSLVVARCGSESSKAKSNLNRYYLSIEVFK